jgi:sec-independent protein translocase protein TatA
MRPQCRKRGFMTPLLLDLGVSELLIILAVVLLLFGGTRLAGLGKSAGRALREFKEETKGLGSEENQPSPPNPAPGTSTPAVGEYEQLSQTNTPQPRSGVTYEQPPRANQDPPGTDRRNDA